MSHDQTEQRKEFRLDTQLVIFLELPDLDGTARSNIAVCHSVNVSASGLSVITHQALEANTILRACVQSMDYAHRFSLSIEIMWSKATDDPEEFSIGLSIFDSEDTDIIAWKEFVAEKFLLN